MTDLLYDTRLLTDRTALDCNYSKIGRIADVYVDKATGRPEWLAIKTGLFGTKLSFAPLTGAHVYGDDVVVRYDASLVKDAPKVEADGQLTADQELDLYRHYGIDLNAITGNGGKRGGRAKENESARGTAETMTRSEEQLDVKKRTRHSGTARLRKWIETEDVEVRVPVQHEKVRVITEPITDASHDKAMAVDDLTTGQQEIVLNEEVVEVEKRVVPKERVRLETETESDEVPVNDTVRKERIEFEQDTPQRPRAKRSNR